MFVNRIETDHGPFHTLADAKRYYAEEYYEFEIVKGDGNQYLVMVGNDPIPAHILEEV